MSAIDAAFRTAATPVGVSAMQKAFGGATSTVLKGLFGGGFRRMGTGAMIGGLYGGFTSEEGSQMGFMGDVLGGTAAGLGIGALTTRTALKLGKEVGRTAITKGPAALWGVTKSVGRIVSPVGRFALNRPKTAGAIGLGIAGAGALAMSGYGDANASAEAMSMMAEQRGIPSTSSGGNPGYLPEQAEDINPLMLTRTGRRYNEFVNSTNGLVFGLHQGRHK